MDKVISALANALGQYRKTPGSNEAWVDGVLSKFERDRPEQYARARRTRGLALGLASLAGLREEESAALGLGLLFHGLIGDAAPDTQAQPPRAWTDYLASEPWVTPCLHTVEFVRTPDWEEGEGYAAGLVASIALHVDKEVLVKRAGTINVLRSLPGESESRVLNSIMLVVWSEEGQALFDSYVRTHGERYRLDGGEVKEAVRLLKGAAPRASRPARQDAAPASPAERLITHRSRLTEGVRRGAEEVTSDNFERRKRALASSASLFAAHDEAPPAAGHDEPPIEELVLEPEPEPEPEPERDTDAFDEGLPAYEPADELEPWPAPARANGGSQEASAQPDGLLRIRELVPKEDAMDILRTPPTRTASLDELGLAERLDELKARFAQIERIASESQELLRGLVPYLDQFSTMLAQFEAILGKPKAHSGIGKG